MISTTFVVLLATCFCKSHAFSPCARIGEKQPGSALRMIQAEGSPDKEAIKRERLAVAANEARGLAMDAIARAHSGYFSMPLGDAEIAAVLFGDQMIYHPADPDWINRDRFVLSPGQGSTLLYSWLHLAGYDLSLEDLAQHRQKDAFTPGFPELRMRRTRNTPGVECTSGPLGQGVGVAVGMAASAKMAAATYNTDDHKIFQHHIFCLAGNGCLQEGVSAEACAFAAHEGLDNLILLYDDNGITLDKMAEYTQSENILQRYEAYGWDVLEIQDGHNITSILETISRAKSMEPNGRPKFIRCKTITGRGMEETEGTNAAYAEAGVPYVDRAKFNLGLPKEEEEEDGNVRGRRTWSGTSFWLPPMKQWFVSAETRELFSNKRDQNEASYNQWKETFRAWKQANPELSKQLDDALSQETLPVHDMLAKIPPLGVTEPEATRISGFKVIQHIARLVPHYVTGAADLTDSTRNYITDGGNYGTGFDKSYAGKNLYFGAREHAMGTILSGFAFHGLYKISGATFLAFSDYLRPAIRMACISELDRVSYIFTYDSISFGEDGPTHQPVETLSGLRVIPNLDVFRPADAEETVAAMVSSVTRKGGPTALLFSRCSIAQNLDLDAKTRREGALRGGYIAKRETSDLNLIILASGSEVPLALEVAHEMPGARVVSMPCMEAFERQPMTYKEEILPTDCGKRIAIEAGVSGLWYKYARKVVGVDKFGFSAPWDVVMRENGVSADNLEKNRSG